MYKGGIIAGKKLVPKKPFSNTFGERDGFVVNMLYLYNIESDPTSKNVN